MEDELKEAAAKNKLPKAIIAVDILGQSADMDAVQELADRFEVPVIEDAAEALGASYKGRAAGRGGIAAAFSFNGNKIITTSGGGMLCSDDQELIERTRFLATQAKDPVPYYQHSVSGFNYRMSNVLAAVGLAQLDVLSDRIARRREIREIYRTRLAETPGISLMPEAPWGESNAWLTVITVDNKAFGASCEDIRLALEEQNIESRRVWIPMHNQPAFKGFRCRGGSVAERLFETALCLPSGTAMSDQVVAQIASVIKGVRKT